MFNKIPKYSVNDIVIIEQGFYNVVGIIKDVFNHRNTGEVLYHIIFNSSTPRKYFEEEIKDKINTDRFKDGQSIHKQLLVKMYHTKSYKYLSEKEVIAWLYGNGERFDKPEFFPECRNIPIELEQSLKKVNNNIEYRKIIFNGPCTIILWTDGSKTISKCSEDDIFDSEKGIAVCFMKRALGEREAKKVLKKEGLKNAATAANVSKELDDVIKKENDYG